MCVGVENCVDGWTAEAGGRQAMQETVGRSKRACWGIEGAWVSSVRRPARSCAITYKQKP